MVRVLAAAVAAAALVGGASTAPAPLPPVDAQPWWSPQGTTIAFQRTIPATAESDVVFTGAAGGREADIVGAGRARGFRPGGGELLVEIGSSTSVRDASDRQVGLVPGTDASWSPDGAQVAFLQGDALEVSPPSGADPRVLARGLAPPASDSGGPAWSPDGSAIAVSTASASGSAIEVVSDTGGAPHVAFDGPGENVDPSWSADGATIAFARYDGAHWSVWLVGRDGSDPHEVFAAGANDRFPQWSPVDGRLAFISDRTGSYALYVGTPGGAAQTLVGSVEPDSPARWSPNGSALAVASTGDCHRFGITVVASSGTPKPLRRSNQCRIDGTAGADYITGSPYYDLINGNGGDDRIFSGNGNDVVYGGPGNDAIGGGPGNDHIEGGPGNDILSGGTGNDVIVAGPGRDKVGCGPGDDTAYVGPGDTVRACEHVHRSR